VIELFTAILSHREVRFKFFSVPSTEKEASPEGSMRSTVSSFAAWFKDRAMLWLSLVDAIETEERDNTSQLFKHTISYAADNSKPSAVPLPVGYSESLLIPRPYPVS